jgi:hypoxanthine phosphoribosyltransferase
MRILFNQTQIQEAVNKIAQVIHNNHHNDPNPPVMICVLNGAFMFFTDLVRQIRLDCEIDFMQVRSYQGKTQYDLHIVKDISIDLKGKNVYVIDDILDSGNTMKLIMTHLGKYHNPRSITPVTLFKKVNNDWPILYGLDLDEEVWICGYGLDDSRGLMRNRSVVFGESQEID